jgi:N-acetylglucosamine kinase-like BadF-type ATPase
MLDVLARLGYSMPLEIVNDAILGLLAGAEEGWGVAVIAGTGCNCWGWDRTRQRVGHATGGGPRMGEHAGGGDLVQKAAQSIAHEWTRRGPPTSLTPLLVDHAGARDLEDLLEGLMTGVYRLEAAAAPLVFRAAAEGDAVAEGLVRWAGHELGELANGVIRQLGFEGLEFDVVQMGSLWKGSPTLSVAMLERLITCAPGARLVGLSVPPVYGAVILAGEVSKSATHLQKGTSANLRE